MVFLDFFTLEFLILLVILYFVVSNNIMILLYNAGLYLLLAGLYSLLHESDIYIGFLWVIDLGVGLIFFIFMLHFLPFLNQTSNFDTTIRIILVYSLLLFLTIFYFFILSFNIDNFVGLKLNKL